MIPHIAIVKHDPPNSYGDCLRASIASLLNIENVDDVPHFLWDGDDAAGAVRLHEWLAMKGYRAFITALNGNNSLPDLFTMMKEANTDIPYLLFCRCSGDDHVLICRNDKIEHDTAICRAPISGPGAGGFWTVMVMTPIEL